MVRTELVARVAALNRRLSRAQVETIVSAILARISEALEAGDRVELRGLGVFWVKARHARLGVNPATGSPIEVASKGIVGFKAAKGMQSRLNALAPSDPAEVAER